MGASQEKKKKGKRARKKNVKKKFPLVLIKIQQYINTPLALLFFPLPLPFFPFPPSVPTANVSPCCLPACLPGLSMIILMNS